MYPRKGAIQKCFDKRDFELIPQALRNRTLCLHQACMVLQPRLRDLGSPLCLQPCFTSAFAQSSSLWCVFCTQKSGHVCTSRSDGILKSPAKYCWNWKKWLQSIWLIYYSVITVLLKQKVDIMQKKNGKCISNTFLFKNVLSCTANWWCNVLNVFR